jgi:penicillin amidase
MGFGRAAEAELAGLDPQSRQVLDWYAEGVNAFMESHKPKRLAAEFNLLGVTPEPWTPPDTLAFTKIMAWALSGNWEHELTRLRLLHELGPHRAAELEPDYPSQIPVILEAAGSQEVTRMLYTAGLILNQYEQLKGWIGVAGDGQGSNSWVLVPDRTLTRRPLLANDPHLTLQMPGIWYENRLSCPGLDVSGVSFAGVPGVVIGHNEWIVWGMTNGVAVQDASYSSVSRSRSINSSQ